VTNADQMEPGERAMDTISEAAEQVSRKARRAARSTTKDLAKTAEQARRTARDMASNVLPITRPKRRKRWPWLLGITVLAAGAAGTAYAMRGRQQGATDAGEPELDHATMNGAGPHPRREQHVDTPASRD
jgi:hypothetical protein